MFPREHGAWSMLLQPVIVAAILARTWHWTALAALTGIITVFLIRQPLIVLARQQFVWKTPHEETPLARRWLLGLGVAALASGAALISRWPIELLVLMALGAGAMTSLAVWATIRNKQRGIALQIVSAAGLTSSSIAIGASDCHGSIPAWAFWLWGAMALQAAASILVVHARLDARIRVRKPNAELDRPTPAFAAQGLLILAALTLLTRQEWFLAAAFALPGILNWIELTRVSNGKSLDIPLTTIGLRAMSVSFVVNALLGLGLWSRCGC